MAITYGGVNGASGAGTSGSNIPLPTGAASGNLIISNCYVQGTVTLSVNSGWTLIGQMSANGFTIGSAAKVITSGTDEPTWSWTGSNTWAANTFRYTGQWSGGFPIGNSKFNMGSGTSATVGSIQTSGTNSFIFTDVNTATTTQTIPAPAGYTSDSVFTGPGAETASHIIESSALTTVQPGTITLTTTDKWGFHQIEILANAPIVQGVWASTENTDQMSMLECSGGNLVYVVDSGNSGTSSSFTVPLPSPLNAGNILISNIYVNGNVTLSVSSGWTLIGQKSNGSNYTIGKAYKLATGSESSGPTWTWTGSFAYAGNIFEFKNNLDTAICVGPNSSFNIGTGTTASGSSINATKPDSVFLIDVTTRATNQTVPTPSGYEADSVFAGSQGSETLSQAPNNMAVSPGSSGAPNVTLGTSDTWGYTIIEVYTSGPGFPTGTWASTENKDTADFVGNAFIVVTGSWHSTENKDTLAVKGSLIGGTWASTENKDVFAALVDPVMGTWESTEGTDVFHAHAVEIDGSIIQSVLFPLSMSMSVTEIIPTRINMTLPGFNQVMEVEEVPATFFVTAAVVTNLKGFSQQVTVHVDLPGPVSVAEMDPPGRGGGGLPTISTERELLDLFGGHAFNRGVDAVVPSTRVASSNLTTAFSPKSIVRPPTPPPPSPRRRK